MNPLRTMQRGYPSPVPVVGVPIVGALVVGPLSALGVTGTDVVVGVGAVLSRPR
jgi:hypothetical protein